MAAVLAKGRTQLYNAACEPHVQDLCRLLVAMGAQITGIGTNLLTIEGVSKLHGVEQRIGPDYIDAGSYLVAALVTGGELTVEGVTANDFAVLERPFRRFGVNWTIEGQTLKLPPGQKLRTSYDLGDAIPKIEDGPWPAFPSDLMSVLIVLATRTRGTTLFFEKMFESRMYFVDRLIAMGANAAPAAGNPMFAWKFEQTTYSARPGDVLVGDIVVTKINESKLTLSYKGFQKEFVLGGESN